MNADEKKVAEFLAKKKLSAGTFSKGERYNGKTPDFRVSNKNILAFFCEVKSIEKDPIDGLRNDPVFNRLTDDIHSAMKQFDAVNPKVETPNVLAFLNHDRNCGFNDLMGVLFGKFIAEGGHSHSIR